MSNRKELEAEGQADGDDRRNDGRYARMESNALGRSEVALANC